jgi:predicted dinucleotide-binding enzyme
MTDSVGIIGAGRLGRAMARTALRAGRRVVVTNSRGPESLASVVSALRAGVSPGPVDGAASAGISKPPTRSAPTCSARIHTKPAAIA